MTVGLLRCGTGDLRSGIWAGSETRAQRGAVFDRAFQAMFKSRLKAGLQQSRPPLPWRALRVNVLRAKTWSGVSRSTLLARERTRGLLWKSRTIFVITY